MSITVMKPVDEQDKEKLYQFLYQLWADEFKRSITGMDHEKKVIIDDLDDWAHHFIAVDEAGRIVGCIRTNWLKDGILNQDLSAQLQLKTLLTVVEKEKITYTSHLAVSPEVRGRTVASLLVAAVINFQIHHEIVADISYCTLNLTHLYYQIGSRPYCSNFRIPQVGLRVPLIYCPFDLAYLKSVESPAVRFVPEEKDDKGETAVKLQKTFSDFCNPGFDRYATKALWARLAHTEPNEEEAKPGFLDDFSAEELTAIMEHVTKVTFQANDTIYAEGESEPGMGILLSGCLGVSVGDAGEERYVAVLKPGEPFGEMMMLSGMRRCAGVVALEKSEALLFAPDLIDRVEKAHPNVAYRLSKNLLKVLTKRLVNANRALSDVGRAVSRGVHVMRSASYHGVSAEQEAVLAKESYQFSNFNDQEEEYVRLKIQATVAEAVEFNILESVGLSEGQVVLDLGAGPGVTSSLIAMRYTTNEVIGIEPDETLRKKAKALVEKQGLGHRCDFKEGTAEKIPLSNNSVDFSYARLLFQHLPHKELAIKEMARVTRPGGVVCILDADDRSIILQPEVKGWDRVEALVAKAQASYGGDRSVGRKLYALMKGAGLKNVRTTVFPVTMDDVGREAFFQIVFGFKKQLLIRINEWNADNQRIFQEVYHNITQENNFAMTNVFVGHGVVG